MAPGIVEDVQHAVGNAADFIATKSIFPDTADSEEYARALDAADPLRGFRDQFIIPSRTSLKSRSLGGLGVFVIASLFAPLFVLTVIPSGSRDNDDGGGGGGGGGDCIYLCGNSLGLQPRRTAGYVQAQLDTWASVGVGGHFTEMAHSPLKPWQSMADFAAAQSCGLVGARPGEVAVENTLTVNLHLLMASFYRPTPTRHKVLLERKAFPSDHIAWHGRSPAESMILVGPEDDGLLSTDAILAAIDAHADEIALVLLPGIQYYTGQWLDISRITRHAHSRNLTIGWDLAHAAGNVPLRLHDWGVDFAAWCTYKYVNAGPGAIGGLFVHERHGKVERPEGPDGGPVFRHRLTGWYGGDQASRFQMDNEFHPIPGAAGWQISNPSAVDLASLCAALAVFGETSIDQLRQKSLRLTAYLQHLLLSEQDPRAKPRFRIVTPLDPSQRGAQLSLLLLEPGLLDRVGGRLQEAGIVVDQRKPDVIRAAPVPLYNTYHDVWVFARVFKKALADCA